MDKKELDFLISEGEGYNLEFKEAFSSDISKEICAFANATGGRILIGISDNKKIKGIEITNRLKSQIHDLVRNFDPKLEVSLDQTDNILIINVPEGKNKPYSANGKFYVRQGTNSQQLTTNEIRELFNKQGKLMYEEMINKEFTIKEFNTEKFDEFLQKAKISKTLPFRELLLNMGLTNAEGQFKNAGIILFAKNIEQYIPQGIITCVLYKGTDKAIIIDRKDYNKDLLNNYNEAISFLYRHLSLRYEIKGFGPRKEILEIPEEALKEAVVNAICHRDYAEKGAVIQIDVFDDRVEISNPGGLIFKESEFGKRSFSRNPLIFGLLQRIELVEHVGSGIARIRKAITEAELPEPKFEFGFFFTTTLYKSTVNRDKSTRKVPEKVTVKVPEKVTVNQSKIIEAITQNTLITVKEMSVIVGISERKIKVNIAKLKSKGLLKRIGPDKGGHWEIQ